jgi:prepilin-type N-terminal cleavage/methylation domain-containing protein
MFRPEARMSGKELTMRLHRGAGVRPIERETTVPQGRGLGHRRSRNTRSSAGFTLIELMIVVVIIGILAAIVIPNFIAMQNRAKEGSTKANMHTVQMSVEDFGLLNDGQYPTSASSSVPDGRTLDQVCPTGGYPINPYTHAASIVRWNANPVSGSKGELALNPALGTNYVVKGNGSRGDTLSLTLTSGQ